MSYALDQIQVQNLLRQYEDTGYGYVNYPEQHGYGVCIANAEWYSTAVHDLQDATQIFFQERAYDDHQDVIAFMRRPIADAKSEEFQAIGRQMGQLRQGGEPCGKSQLGARGMRTEGHDKAAAEHWVRALYQHLLKRDPGEAELAGWIGAAAGGLSDRELFHHFVASEEYKEKNRVQPAHPAGHYYSPVVDPSTLVGSSRPSGTWRPRTFTDRTFPAAHEGMVG